MALPTFEEFYSRAKAKYPNANDEAIKAAYSQRTGQDAVFTQGPSFEEFSSRAVAKYGPLDPNVLKQAYDARYSSSYLTDLKRAAKRGFGQFGDVVGAGLEAVGADDLGSSVREYWQETQDENRQSVESQNRAWYNPAKIAESSVEMGVNMLPTLGIGGGLGAGARLLGAGTKVAGAIGTGAASGVGGVQEALPFYEQLIEQGVDPETARAKAAALGVYVAAANVVPTGRILGRTPGRLKTGAWEAATETSEETAQALLEGKDPLKATIEGAKAVGPAAFLMGAGLGAGGQARPSASAEEEFRRQAGLEDTPTPEPESDVAAQVAEIGKTRKGVYLAPGQTGDFPGIKVPVPGGGELLVQSQQDAQEALLRFQSEDRQTVLGQFTGAGMQPKPNSDVVIQALRDGTVIRESVVLPEEAQERARAMEAELGVPVKITTAAEALKRRSDLIQAEGLGKQPGLPKSGGIDRNRPYPPGVQPAEPGEPIDYNPPTDLLVPKAGTYEPAKGDTVNLGQRVVVPGTGVVPQVAADRDAELVLDVPKTVKGYKEIRAMEAGLPNQAKAELAAQARDAQAFLPEFTERLANIAERIVGNRLSVFGEFQPGALVAPVKSAGKTGWARVIEKVVTEEGGNPILKDFGRATILVRNKAEAQAALDAILADFGQFPGTNIRRSLLDSNSLEEVLKRDPYGYADVKLNVPGPNGRAYEVQITTPELFRLKEEQGHKFYERGRAQEGKFLTAFQKVVGRRLKNDQAAIKKAIDAGARMFRERDPLMQKEYQGSRQVYAPALESFFAASQSASNSASEISLPSARMDEGVTGTKESPTSLAPTAPDSSAGLPSTEKNIIPSISPTSGSSVAGDSQGSNRARTISVPGSGRKFQVRSRIVSLSQLLSSDQPGYDQRKQPRDREGRVALQLQAENIAAKLDPNQLMESRSTADGAPVVSPEGLVESGNGRVMALRIAQQKHPENYAAYVEALKAEGFNVDGIADPVLVQERVTPMTDQEIIAYTQEANARGNASLSATEQAKMDARLLDESVLTGINSGDMSQAQNLAAISAFFDRLPVAERNGLVDAKGKPNAAGERRAEAALVAKAYANANGIDALLDRLYETQDEGVRRITNALRMASYKFAELRLSLETGRVPAEYDIAQDVIGAYNFVREGRAKGIDPWYLVKQGDMTASPNQAAVLRMFYKPDGKEQTTETIASQLIYYAQQANQQRLDQGGLFGGNETVLVEPGEILQTAVDLIGNPNPSMPDKAGKFAKQGQYRPGGMQAWAVKQLIDPIVARWNPAAAPRVVVVQDAGELPTEVLAALGPDIRGATDMNTGAIYLVANNLGDSWSVQRVLAHESVGHFGFDRLYGDRFPKMVDQIIALEGKDAVIAKIGKTIDRHYDNLDRSTRAAEIVAHLAETQPKHPMVKRVLAQFREILRAMGLRINLSRNDLVYLIRKAADAMVDRNAMQRDLSARQLKPGPMESRGPTEQTETPEFKQWFNNSQVVNPDGTPKRVYHGTTFDFTEFEITKAANEGNHHGKGFYFTTKPSDVGDNYATAVGLDAKLKVELAAEPIMERFEDSFARKNGGRRPEWGKAEWSRLWTRARKIAEKSMLGPNEGLVMPVYLSIQNPVKVGGPDGTSWEYDFENYDEETEEFEENPDSKGAELMAAVNHVLIEEDAQKVGDFFMDHMSITAKELEKLVRDGSWEYEGPAGRGPGAALQEIYRRLGFDGIRIEAGETFPNMTSAGGQHWVAFEPTQVKSAVGNRGSFDPKDPNILASIEPKWTGGDPNKYVDLDPPFARQMERFDAQLRELFKTFRDTKAMTQPGTKERAIRDEWFGLLRRRRDYWRMARRRSEQNRKYLEQRRAKLEGKPATDQYGRPLDEKGRPLDQQGRPIPKGQEDAFGLELPPAEPAQEQPFNLAQQEAPREEIADPGTADLFGLSQLANEPIRGQAPPAEPAPTMPTRGQGRLFASRGATITEDLPLETPAQPVRTGPQAWAGPVKVGGGEYQLKQFGKLDQSELNVLHSVIGSLEAPVTEQRRGTRSWTATEQAAIDLVQERYGVTLDGLVNRKPGSAANAEQLEAYGMMIGKVSSELKTLVDGMGRNPSSEELAKLADLKERLGMLLAPAMGYQTEAGRALNILRKISGELKNADDILAAMGDGAEGTLKDFAKRVRDAGSIDQVVGLTRAAYTPTWWDRFYEYWINGLLSGPTTHSVNMVSNAVFQALESAAEFAAAPFSKDVSTRAAMARLAAIPHGVTLGMANAKTAFLEERAVLTPEDKLEGEHNKAIPGMAGKVIRLPGRALQAEDEFFKAVAYQGELAALAMEEAIRANPADVMGEFHKIMGSQRHDLIKAAKKKAAQVTFTTPLGPNMAALSRVLNKSKVGRLIIPFIRTPTNILFEATKYTPAAPLLEEVRKDLSGGGRDAALGWSRMAIGSGVMLGFAAMAAQGILSGAGPDDDATRSQLMRQGWRPYSIKLPDGSWLKYNRFEPFGMLTGLAADLFEIGSTMSEGDYSAASSMLLTSLASNLGDKTFLRGVTEFSQAYADPKRYLSRWANGMLSSPVPNALGQTARWVDPYQREANTIIDNYKAKIPGMSGQLAKRLDLAGEPIQRDTGVPGNPFATSTPRQDPLAAAMIQLGVRKNAPGKSLSVRGMNYRLEGEAYTSYKGYVQKARYQLLTPLVNSPQFKQLMAQNPMAAQALLEKQWDDVGRQARLSWLYKNPSALGNPVQAPGGKDLAGSYALN